MKKLCVVHLNLTIKLIALATANHCRYTSYVRNENEEKYISYNQLRDASKLDEGSQRLYHLYRYVYMFTHGILANSHIFTSHSIWSVCLLSTVFFLFRFFRSISILLRFHFFIYRCKFVDVWFFFLRFDSIFSFNKTFNWIHCTVVRLVRIIAKCLPFQLITETWWYQMSNVHDDKNQLTLQFIHG